VLTCKDDQGHDSDDRCIAVSLFLQQLALSKFAWGEAGHSQESRNSYQRLRVKGSLLEVLFVFVLGLIELPIQFAQLSLLVVCHLLQSSHLPSLGLP